jgi:hypothetical protein
MRTRYFLRNSTDFDDEELKMDGLRLLLALKLITNSITILELQQRCLEEWTWTSKTQHNHFKQANRPIESLQKIKSENFIVLRIAKITERETAWKKETAVAMLCPRWPSAIHLEKMNINHFKVTNFGIEFKTRHWLWDKSCFECQGRQPSVIPSLTRARRLIGRENVIGFEHAVLAAHTCPCSWQTNSHEHFQRQVVNELWALSFEF